MKRERVRVRVEKIKLEKIIKEYIYIIIGTTLLALGITLFYEPDDLVTGGVVGLGIIVKSVAEHNFGIQMPLWLNNLLFNIPLFIAAIIVKGKRFGVKSLFATIYLTVALYYTSLIYVPKYDLLISSIYGGVLTGIGLGMVFGAYGTTGGTDMLASIVNYYIRGATVGKILFYIDGIIIAMGFWVFGIEKGLYAIIAVFVTTKVLDGMLEGVKFAKAVYIVSEQADEIGHIILKKLGRGVTVLSGRGMYSNKDKNVLFCVVGKRQIVKLKDMIQGIDQKAFVVVYDAREVLGEGF
ncbi:MAG TPA: YitT family protein [Clostridiales bacterium]|nr:YitT family protein [Clostridiales bacterium]